MNKMIPWSKPSFISNEKLFLNKAFDSTWISSGSYVEKFENLFCRYTKSKFAISVIKVTHQGLVRVNSIEQLQRLTGRWQHFAKSPPHLRI